MSDVPMAHYWYRPAELPQALYRDALNDAQKVVERMAKDDGIRITRFHDSPEPAVWGIFFIHFSLHGQPQHTYFRFERVFTGDPSDPLPNGYVFDACVTKGGPHDHLVCAALIALKRHLGELLIVQSEGASTNRSWTLARQACQKVLGYGEDFKPET